ncbi:hypothetical protein AcV7_003368 [Taiwanofungus camphoratus]|nr:hypothetical protein AcV7_003368 [Antrodia cinnamomea]
MLASACVFLSSAHHGPPRLTRSCPHARRHAVTCSPGFMIQLKHPPLTSDAAHCRLAAAHTRLASASPLRLRESPCPITTGRSPHLPPLLAIPAPIAVCTALPAVQPPAHTPAFCRELIGFPRASLGGHPGARRISGTHTRSIASGLSHPDLTSTHMLHAGQRRVERVQSVTTKDSARRARPRRAPRRTHSPCPLPPRASCPLLAVGRVCLSWTGGARGHRSSPSPSSSSSSGIRHTCCTAL